MIHRENEDNFLEFDYEGFLSSGNSFMDETQDSFDGEEEEPSSDFDEAVLDSDFSEIRGKSYKNTFSSANRQVQRKQTIQKGKRRVPKKKIVSRRTELVRKNIPVQSGVRNLKGTNRQKISNVIVPSSQKVIVKGVSQFILSQNNESEKRIRYYKGKKLKELIVIVNNLGSNDFTFNLFDPSMPVDYLYATGDNLNNRIQIAGGEISYSDMLFNLLANPTMILRSQLNMAGPNVAGQGNQSLFMYNKSITGEQEIVPYNLNLQIDSMQVFNDVVYFDVSKTIKRPFIPDGMDVMKYTVLAGNSITFTFFYTQVSLKKFFFKEARVKDTMKIQ